MLKLRRCSHRLWFLFIYFFYVPTAQAPPQSVLSIHPLCPLLRLPHRCHHHHRVPTHMWVTTEVCFISKNLKMIQYSPNITECCMQMLWFPSIRDQTSISPLAFCPCPIRPTIHERLADKSVGPDLDYHEYVCISICLLISNKRFQYRNASYVIRSSVSSSDLWWLHLNTVKIDCV